MTSTIELCDRAFNERSIEAINDAVIAGCGTELIQLSEVFHSRQFSSLADEVANRLDTKLVLIAGPSSSSKTTTSKRLALHLKTIGINTIVVSMDDYFKRRQDTPRDEKGEYDFECLGAMDVALLNEQLNALFEGREVNLPTFDFVSGERVYDPAKKVRMGRGDIVIMEGIHGLNPDLTPDIDPLFKFSIYAAVINALNIPDLPDIEVNGRKEDSVSITRLLRRMVRDQQFRGNGPEATILRWRSVRAGEVKNIEPFRDNADATFDSSLIYEIPLFKSYVDTLLRRVPGTSPVHEATQGLLDYIMNRVVSLTPREVDLIPSTSVIREFIGGSSFKY